MPVKGIFLNKNTHDLNSQSCFTVCWADFILKENTENQELRAFEIHDVAITITFVFFFRWSEIIGNRVPFLGWNVQINLLLLLVTVLVYNNYSRCYHLWFVPTPSILSFISCIEIEHNRPITDSWGISKTTVCLSDLLVSVWTIYFLSLSYGNFKSS